ncbi:MAG: hypothetical protein Q4G08_06650 [Capnocytophaga sp.]|nr:hypothetical protein [Capnocytophaga sp.]
MIKLLEDDLMQELVNLNVTNLGLTPIAAQILACIKSDFKNEGVTFDQLQEVLDVSKGSISLNLKTLISKGIILEINKFNDRKRYFVINPEFSINRIREVIEKLEHEIKVFSRVNECANRECDANPDFLKKMKIYKELSDNIIQLLKESLLKLESI